MFVTMAPGWMLLGRRSASGHSTPKSGASTPLLDRSGSHETTEASPAIPAALSPPSPYSEPDSFKEAASKVLNRLKRDQLDAGNDAPNRNSFNVFEAVTDADADELTRLASQSFRGKRAMGAMAGMAVADSIGHMFEFVPVDRKGCRFDPSSLRITGEYNRFKLKPGQWTDDTSMGLCLADSLLVKGVYNGSDIRVRFWNWWFQGYNNAFHREANRSNSVGLGGNIRSSLQEIKDACPPARFESFNDDAGIGSLMRLAPIPILFHMDFKLVMRMSAESSFTTHPGPTASSTCAFLGFLIARAMTRNPNSRETAAQFLDSCVADFSVLPDFLGDTELLRLLRSAEPPGSKERCWNWRDPKGLYLLETVEVRGKSYNGYPVSKEYFGSFCMDGLAMALFSFYHTTTFMAALAKCVNMLGDADSTGAIVGQLAGAFYGIDGIDKRLLGRLRQWDHGEIALRGALLYTQGIELSAAARNSTECLGERRREVTPPCSEMPGSARDLKRSVSAPANKPDVSEPSSPGEAFSPKVVRTRNPRKALTLTLDRPSTAEQPFDPTAPAPAVSMMSSLQNRLSNIEVPSLRKSRKPTNSRNSSRNPSQQSSPRETRKQTTSRNSSQQNTPRKQPLSRNSSQQSFISEVDAPKTQKPTPVSFVSALGKQSFSRNSSQQSLASDVDFPITQKDKALGWSSASPRDSTTHLDKTPSCMSSPSEPVSAPMHSGETSTSSPSPKQVNRSPSGFSAVSAALYFAEEPHAARFPPERDVPAAFLGHTTLNTGTSLNPGPLPSPGFGPSIPEANVPILFLTSL